MLENGNGMPSFWRWTWRGACQRPKETKLYTLSRPHSQGLTTAASPKAGLLADNCRSSLYPLGLIQVEHQLCSSLQMRQDAQVMKLSRLPLLVQSLVYPALGKAAKHHVRREKTLNRTQCRAGVHLEPVYPRALNDLKTLSARFNSKA